MNFTKKHKNQAHDIMRISNEPIETKQIQYLGVTLDKKLPFGDVINETIRNKPQERSTHI